MVTGVQTCALPISVNVDIPFGIPAGQTGMRVRSRGATNGAIDACTQFFTGETEDYVVTIDIGTGIKNITNSKSLSLINYMF